MGKFINKNEYNKIDEYLIEYYENNLEKITESITELYPNRKQIIIDAKNAHKKELYTLSTPVFLSQSDGIFHEKTKGKQIFTTRDDLKKEIDTYFRKNITLNNEKKVTSVFLYPFLNIYNFHDNEKKIKTDYNRHGILHGRITDYNTKTNSLKALSLLTYITMVFNSIENMFFK